MHEFTSGAKSSEPGTRFDLLELEFLTRVADRMAQGAQSHGERNYLKGTADPQFIQDRKNHLIAHVLKFVAGDTSDDHLAAAGANLNMLAVLVSRTPNVHEIVNTFIANEHAARPNTLTYDDRRTGQPPCACGRWFTHPEKCRAESRCCALDHPHVT